MASYNIYDQTVDNPQLIGTLHFDDEGVNVETESEDLQNFLELVANRLDQMNLKTVNEYESQFMGSIPELSDESLGVEELQVVPQEQSKVVKPIQIAKVRRIT